MQLVAFLVWTAGLAGWLAVLVLCANCMLAGHVLQSACSSHAVQQVVRQCLLALVQAVDISLPIIGAEAGAMALRCHTRSSCMVQPLRDTTLLYIAAVCCCRLWTSSLLSSTLLCKVQQPYGLMVCSKANAALSLPQAVDIFLAIIGAEAGAMALRCLARGGVFIAGGIVPRLMERVKTGAGLGLSRLLVEGFSGVPGAWRGVDRWRHRAPADGAC